MWCGVRLDVYFPNHGKNCLSCEGDGRDYRTEGEQITEITIGEFRGKANVKPVLESRVYQFKKTPVSGRDYDEKRQVFIENVKSFVFERKGRIKSDNIGPPGRNVEKIIEWFYLVVKGQQAERKEDYGKNE